MTLFKPFIHPLDTFQTPRKELSVATEVGSFLTPCILRLLSGGLLVTKILSSRLLAARLLAVRLHGTRIKAVIL